MKTRTKPTEENEKLVKTLKESNDDLKSIGQAFKKITDFLQKSVDDLSRKLTTMMTDIDDVAFKSKCLEDKLKLITKEFDPVSITENDVIGDQVWVDYLPLVKSLKSANSIFTLLANEINIAKTKLNGCEKQLHSSKKKK